MLSYCAHQIAKREDEVLQWTFTENLCNTLHCAHILICLVSF